MLANTRYFDDCPIACHELDREARIVRVNAAECKLLGYSPAQMIGKPVWEFVVPGKQYLSRLAVMQKLSKSRPVAPFRREYLRADGLQLTLEIHDRLIEDPDGNVAGLCAWVIDKTAQFEKELQWNRQAAWLTAMFDSLPYGLITADSLHRVNYLNAAAARTTGVDRQDALGRDLDEMLSAILAAGEVTPAEEDLLLSEQSVYHRPGSEGKPDLTFYRLEGPRSILGVGVLLR